MVLPFTLPALPPHPKPDVLHANKILVKGYCTARSILDLVRPDFHQVRYHQERVWLELVPLLDAIRESTLDPATRSWCYVVTATFANLFNQLTEHGALTRHGFVILNATLKSRVRH